jgi:hypothetical protein
MTSVRMDARRRRPGRTGGARLFVLIDPDMARIYSADPRGSAPRLVIPYDRTGFGRHLHHVEVDARGRRRPGQGRFNDAIARTLRGAAEILVLACGTGATAARDDLLATLLRRGDDLAGRVVGWIVMDEQHLTEDELLANVRLFYADGSNHEAEAR